MKISDPGVLLYSSNQQITKTINSCHKNDRWRFLLITEGACAYDLQGIRKESGRGMLVMPPELSVRIIAITEDFRGYLFDFPADIVLDSWSSTYYTKLTVKWTGTFKNYYFLMDSILDSPDYPYSGMELVCLCRAFIASCRHHFKVELYANSFSRPAEITKDFLDLVEKYCHQERDLGFYARNLNLSPKYLSAVISSTTKKKANSLISEHTIAYAKKLLLNTHQSVAGVAKEMNFKTASEFCRYFKNYTGASPNVYRHQSGMTSSE